jgi:hypothetical protein
MLLQTGLNSKNLSIYSCDSAETLLQDKDEPEDLLVFLLVDFIRVKVGLGLGLELGLASFINPNPNQTETFFDLIISSSTTTQPNQLNIRHDGVSAVSFLASTCWLIAFRDSTDSISSSSQEISIAYGAISAFAGGRI